MERYEYSAREVIFSQKRYTNQPDNIVIIIIYLPKILINYYCNVLFNKIQHFS